MSNNWEGEKDRRSYDRRGCDVCQVHHTLVDKMDDLTDKIEAMITEVIDLKWVKSIGRFLIGIMVTFMLTAFPLTWKLFDKTADLMINVDKNTNMTQTNHEHLEKLTLSVGEDLQELKKAVEKTNDLMFKHMTDPSQHKTTYNSPSGLQLKEQ